MIKLIQARNFRSLQSIDCKLEDFQVLVGANATGKSTLLDVIQFMSDVLNDGLDKAIHSRVTYFEELTFGGRGGYIELAIELALPEIITRQLIGGNFKSLLYGFSIGKTELTQEYILIGEYVCLLDENKTLVLEEPKVTYSNDTEFRFPLINYNRYRTDLGKFVISKMEVGTGSYFSEIDLGMVPVSFHKLGTKKSALANLSEDETKLPASLWLKSFLQQGVQSIALDSKLLRRPSPPGQGLHFKSDGSNLPWVIEHLKKDPERFTWWLEHIKVAFPDIEGIETVEREYERDRYLKIRYKNGMEVRSWLLSDGTLRFLALTILAYIKDLTGVFLIEEPENGIHPTAMDFVIQSLSSVYNGQVLIATHSMVVVSILKPKELLCFSKLDNGATNIVSGTDHPMLADWNGIPNISILYGSGILS